MIKLSQEHLKIICAHAESTYPEECCGILFGYLVGNSKTVVEVTPTDNAWSSETATDFTGNIETNDDAFLYSKRRRYAIAPQVIFQAQRKARDRHFNIIGIYHSHPDYPNIPSEFDRLYAWQEYSYVIISVKNGISADARSWSLDDNHQFQPEAIQKCS
ncbi:MAG: M67 family metallopeptidase [Rhizonema sp. PD38]|nr:M67 family metallopeptidase [Rhizonema sp. PD38]